MPTIFIKFIKLFVSLFLIVSSAFLLNPSVPNNMDEYSLFHTLACNYYKNNKLNIHNIGCSNFDLKLPFTNVYLPLREFGYMGSILSLYLAPFFLLFPHPIITRIVGLLFLIPQAYFYGKILKREWFFIFLGLLFFFPYFFQHFVDTGTVAIQITLLLASLVSLNEWFTSKKGKYLLFFTILCFLGIFSKLTFFWYLPSLCIYLLIRLKDKKNNKIYGQIVFFSLFFTFLVTILMLSKDRSGFFYLHEFFIDIPNDNLVNTHNFNIISRIINPYISTEMILQPKSHILISVIHSVILLGLTPLSWLIGYLKYKKWNKVSILWFFLFLVTIFVINLTSKAWSIHHAILAYPYLILSFISSVIFLTRKNFLTRKIGYIFLLFFVTYNLYLFFSFNTNKINMGNEYIRYDINTLLSKPQIATEYTYVIVDWGMYYFQSLFGDKNQEVIYIQNFSDDFTANYIRNLARKGNRKLVFIYDARPTETDPEFIKQNFFVEECKLFSQSDSWRILFESGTLTKYCQ